MQAEVDLAAARNSSAAGEAALKAAREGATKAQQAADRLAAKLGEVRAVSTQGFRVCRLGCESLKRSRRRSGSQPSWAR